MRTAPTAIFFQPEKWGTLSKFKFFYMGTHTFDSDTTKAITGVANHFNKAQILYNLARKLSPNLQIDEEELNQNGHTAAINSAEFTAVAEEVFTELYSSIDCTRKIIVSIYRKCRRIPDSTRKIFQRIRDHQLGSDFPDELKKAFLSASWYEDLLRIRDELTHSELGHCTLNRENRSIQYMHTGIKTKGKPLIIPDIFEKIETLISEVNKFLGEVFYFLNTQLKPYITTQVCGMCKGKVLARELPLEEHITFHSGTCISHIWFEKPNETRCPAAETCGAYIRAMTKIEAPLDQ
ncbi:MULTISPECIES: hypothetical protein [unclassified Pseudomonas]